MTRHEPPVPPAPPPPDPELADEVDVDLAEDSAPAPLEREYLGSYASIAGYLRAMFEPEVTPACAWILDLLDYPAVQRRWEGDGGRLVLERGHVYRVSIRAPMAVDPR